MYTDLALLLLLAWLLDVWLGDPRWMPHPVVGFGRLIAWGEHRLNRGWWRRTKGAFLTMGLIVGVLLLVGALQYVLDAAARTAGTLVAQRALYGLRCLVLTLLMFLCLAGHTLRREVRDVFLALDRGLDEGRRQVARIVGRDTERLTAQEVRTAALETLAENLSDGVIAPLFWLVLLGVPGMMTYKMINTLDSMVGYRNERYADFGCCSAKMDDIANFLPSRLTALLMIATYKILTMFMSDEITGVGVTHGSDAAHHRGFMELAGFVSLYGRNHLSPNSGWPEAALAGILDCRFGGGHYYFGEYVHKPYIGETARELTTEDMRLACRVSFLAETMSVTLLSVPFLLMLFFFVAAGGFPGKDTPCL